MGVSRALALCHFERKREIFFVRGQAKEVRKADNGKPRTCLLVRSGSQPPPLRDTSFRGKEGDTRMPVSPCCHFVCSERAFVRGQAKEVRKADNGKPRTCLLVRSGIQPPPLRGTSFRGKEGDTRMPVSPCCHFVRSERAFVRGPSVDARSAPNGKSFWHRKRSPWGDSFFILSPVPFRSHRCTWCGNFLLPFHRTSAFP